MDFAALADFDLVAAHGGFGKASRVSGRPKTSLSRRVRELEEGLGVRLVECGNKAFRLTEAGRLLHGRIHGLLGEISEVSASLSDTKAAPRGLLRLSAPVLFSHVAMGRIAAEFTRAYPDVQVEVIAEDRLVDPVEENYDLVIRVNPQPSDHLVGRCFVHDETLVVAPTSLPRPDGGDVAFPAVLTGAASEDPWNVRDGDVVTLLRPRACVRASSLLVVRDAVLAGAGAARLPWSLVAADIEAGRLACWGKVTDRVVELWVLHASRRLASAKVSAFVDFVCAAFPDRVIQTA